MAMYPPYLASTFGKLVSPAEWCWPYCPDEQKLYTRSTERGRAWLGLLDVMVCTEIYRDSDRLVPIVALCP